MTVVSKRAVALAAAFITTAGAASAQSLCGEASDGGQWIGGTEDASDVATADTYSEQMALVLSGNRYVSVFSLSAPASVRIEAAGRGAGDPMIDILDDSGTVIASDDDSGGEGASRAELDLESGTYCVAVSSYDGTPMTAFVRVGTTDQEALTAGTGQAPVTPIEPDPTPMDEPEPVLPPQPTASGGSCDSATDLGTLGGDTSLTNSASVDDTPYYTFTLDTAQPVTVTASNETADPIITLFDMNESYLAENDDFDGLNSRIDMATPLDTGTYCLSVGALADTTLLIDIAITAYDADAAAENLYATGDTAPPLDGSVEIVDLGTLTSRLREDATVGGAASWFSVTLDSPGLLLMEAIDGTGTGDPFVRVFDDLGRLVTLNDDYGEGYDSLVVVRANAGTYLFSVVQIDGTVSSLTRMVFEKYLPAE